MTLEQLADENTAQAAALLADYWEERNMPQYGQKWAEDYLAKGHVMEIKEHKFLVFKEGEDFIGLVSLIIDVSDVAEIRDMVIRPEFRNKGYGTKMLDELVGFAKQKNVRKLFALVFPQYTKIYGSAGFEKEGILKSHFADNEDLTIMSRFL